MSPSQRATPAALRPSPPVRPLLRPLAAPRCGVVVHRAERGVDADVVAVQVDPGAVGLAPTEHEPPPPQPLRLRHAVRMVGQTP